ncbi:MAG: mechanosensitive ion channel domain-containing protein, partial [Rubrobacter sp.]
MAHAPEACFAQEVAATPTRQEVVTPQGYPVELDGKTIFHLRAQVKGVVQEQRARAISERITRYAVDPYFRTDLLTSQEGDYGTDVVSADHPVMTVLEMDAQAEGRSRQEVAAEYARRTRAAIEQHRRDYSARNILRGALFALLATLALALFFVLLARSYRKIVAGLNSWAEVRASARSKSLEFVPAARVKSLLLEVVRLLRLAVVLLVLYFYLDLVLALFPWTHPYAVRLFDYVAGPLRTIAASVRAQIPNLFFVAILALIARYVLKLTRAFFDGVASRAITVAEFDPDWAVPTYKIVRVLVIAFTVVVAYPYIPGSSSEAFKGVSIFLGVLLSFGSSSAVANVVAGLTMTYMRAFKVGDRVKIADHTGDVVNMWLQVTHLRT